MGKAIHLCMVHELVGKRFCLKFDGLSDKDKS